MAKGNLVNWVLGARDWRLGDKEWGMGNGTGRLGNGDWGERSLPACQITRLLPYDYIPPGAGLFDVSLQLET